MATNDISGYVLLSMPTDQVKPLGILTKQNKTIVNSTAARIDNLFIDSEVPLPLISDDYLVSANINKTISMEVSVDNHLSLLESLLKYVKLSASFKLDKNKSVKINLMEAKKNTVNEFELDAYINSSKLNKAAKSFISMLENDELFVVTDILKCKKYSLEYTDGKSIDAGLEAAAGNVGDLGAAFHAGKTGEDVAVNEGEEYLTIAVKAYRIFFVRDKRSGEISYRIRKDDVIKTVLDDEDFPGEKLLAETVNIEV